MIHIERVKAQGFCSIINKVKYKFDRPGLNLILGPNGVGKTTIFNALSWGLYGEVLKKGSTVKPWESIAGDYDQGTMVQVDLKNDEGDIIQVIRCLDYKGKIDGKIGGNNLYVFYNGTQIKTKGKVAVQDYIRELLGYSFTLFRTAILMPQELDGLMKETGPDKKKILEEAFEAAYISKAKDIAEKRLMDNRALYNEKQHKIDILRTRYILYRRTYKKNKALFKNFQKTHKNAISDIRVEIRSVRARLKEYKPILQDESGFQNKLDKAKAEYYDLVSKSGIDYVDMEFKANLEMNNKLREVEDIQTEIGKLKFQWLHPDEICHVCGQNLPNKAIIHTKKNLKMNIFAQKKRLNIKKLEYAKLQKEYGVIKEKSSSHEQDKMKISDLNKRIRKLEESLLIQNHTRKKIDILKENLRNLKISLKKERGQTLKINLGKLQHTISRFRALIDKREGNLGSLRSKMQLDEWLVKDPLSNSGLKMYIFETMIKKVNYYLRRYQKFINFGIEVKVDLESHNKDIHIIIKRGEEMINYNDLSKGQKQLTNVALLFAINDTVTQNKPINTLIIDEAFESLSDDNIEIVGNIISQKAQSKIIHLITHQAKFNPLNSYKTFIQANEKGQTIVNTKYSNF